MPWPAAAPAIHIAPLSMAIGAWTTAGPGVFVPAEVKAGGEIVREPGASWCPADANGVAWAVTCHPAPEPVRSDTVKPDRVAVVRWMAPVTDTGANVELPAADTVRLPVAMAATGGAEATDSGGVVVDVVVVVPVAVKMLAVGGALVAGVVVVVARRAVVDVVVGVEVEVDEVEVEVELDVDDEVEVDVEVEMDDVDVEVEVDVELEVEGRVVVTGRELVVVSPAPAGAPSAAMANRASARKPKAPRRQMPPGTWWCVRPGMLSPAG